MFRKICHFATLAVSFGLVNANDKWIMIKSAAITDGAPLQVDFGNDEVKGQTVPGRVFPHWLKRTKHAAMMEDTET